MRRFLTYLWVCVYMAGRGLGANKLRSILTMLGVIIGVAAVIVAVAIGAGSREAVAQSIQQLGTNVLTLRPGQRRLGPVMMGSGSMDTLKYEDAEAILQNCSSVAAVSAEVNGSAQVKAGNQNVNVSIDGTGESHQSIENHYVASGRFFKRSEVESCRRVAVLGADTADQLFGTNDSLNQHIRILGQTFLVVGVLEEKGGQGFRNPDEAVYVPVTTAMRRLFGRQNVQAITCQATNFDTMAQAEQEITALLRKRHGISGSAESDFHVMSQADLMTMRNEQQDTFSSLITWLAVVSLVVGGIGIMNIMFVSVTERTREIGLRKAVGARQRHVLGQFLLEALFISAAGGLLGVVCGVLGSRLVSRANDWQVAVSPQTLIVAFSFSVLVGVFFGFYPAHKASRLKPIEALRYE